MSLFNGGDNDLIKWSVEVRVGELRQVRTMNGALIQVQAGVPSAELTLHDANMEECEAVIALLNEMRGRTRSLSDPPLKPGSRFAGLEFE